MAARVLTGSKQEIAQRVAQLVGEVREAIVFVDDAPTKAEVDSLFDEMEPFTVRQEGVDDSRAAIYWPTEAE